MVTTRAKARHAAQPSTEPLEEADYPLQALQTSQRQRSFEAATFEERDLLEELGVKERPPPKGVQAIIQCAVRCLKSVRFYDRIPARWLEAQQ
jgi:hypothetical protein